MKSEEYGFIPSGKTEESEEFSSGNYIISLYYIYTMHILYLYAYTVRIYVCSWTFVILDGRWCEKATGFRCEQKLNCVKGKQMYPILGNTPVWWCLYSEAFVLRSRMSTIKTVVGKITLLFVTALWFEVGFHDCRDTLRPYRGSRRNNEVLIW